MIMSHNTKRVAPPIPKILSAPKRKYVDVLRKHADVFAKGETKREAVTASVYKRYADTLEKAPGETTKDVHDLALAGQQGRFRAARLINDGGSLGAAFCFAVSIASGVPFLGLALGAAMKGSAFFCADAVAGTSQKFCERMNAVSESSSGDTVCYGQEGLIAEANRRA